MTTTTPTPAAPPALTFPRPIFAAVSPHPFLQAHLCAASKSRNKGLRANGRTALEFRAPGVHTGSLTHCHGSAVVRMGNTSVVCGVRGEILKVEDGGGGVLRVEGEEGGEEEEEEEEEDSSELQRLNLLIPNLELCTGSTPTHIPGTAPSPSAQTLLSRIHSLLHSTRLLHPRQLRILHSPSANLVEPRAPPHPHLKAYWVLYLDIVFISIDGNAFDTAWLALLAALRDTRLPKAYFDEAFDGILCEDHGAAAVRLQLRGCPVPSTFAVFEGRGEAESDDADADAGPRRWVLSDPDAFEEAVCQESVCVVIDGGAQLGPAKEKRVVRRVEKSGGGVVGREEMLGLVERAAVRWSEVRRLLEDLA